MNTNKINSNTDDSRRSSRAGGQLLRWMLRGVSGSVLAVSLLYGMVAEASAKPAAMPGKVQDGLDTIQLWTRIIGGSLAGLTLMFLGIGMWWANRHDKGAEFLQKAGGWVAGALVFSCAPVIATIFVG